MDGKNSIKTHLDELCLLMRDVGNIEKGKIPVDNAPTISSSIEVELNELYEIVDKLPIESEDHTQYHLEELIEMAKDIESIDKRFSRNMIYHLEKVSKAFKKK
jgi:hypothetical protein